MRNQDLDKLKPGDIIFDNKGGERIFWVALTVPGGNYVIQTQDGHTFPVTELHLIKPTSRNVPQYVKETRPLPEDYTNDFFLDMTYRLVDEFRVTPSVPNLENMTGELKNNFGHYGEDSLGVLADWLFISSPRDMVRLTDFLANEHTVAANALLTKVHEHTVKQEKVNHPSHYGGDTPYEAIKVIEAWKLPFTLGNTVKYISRAGKKGDTLEDLKKAAWYLQREIDNLEKN